MESLEAYEFLLVNYDKSQQNFEIGKVLHLAKEVIEKEYPEEKNMKSNFRSGQKSYFKKWYSNLGYNPSKVSYAKKHYTLSLTLKDYPHLIDHIKSLSAREVKLLSKDKLRNSVELIAEALEKKISGEFSIYKELEEFIEGRKYETSKMVKLIKTIGKKIDLYSEEDKAMLFNSIDYIQNQLDSILEFEKNKKEFEKFNDEKIIEVSDKLVEITKDKYKVTKIDKTHIFKVKGFKKNITDIPFTEKIIEPQDDKLFDKNNSHLHQNQENDQVIVHDEPIVTITKDKCIIEKIDTIEVENYNTDFSTIEETYDSNNDQNKEEFESIPFDKDTYDILNGNF